MLLWLLMLQDPENVKSSAVQFIVSFLVTGDNIVIRQLMDVKGIIPYNVTLLCIVTCYVGLTA